MKSHSPLCRGAVNRRAPSDLVDWVEAVRSEKWGVKGIEHKSEIANRMSVLCWWNYVGDQGSAKGVDEKDIFYAGIGKWNQV